MSVVDRIHPDDSVGIRRAWRDLGDQEGPVLRVCVLAGFTADPVVPYLGWSLVGAGLAPLIEVGPFNQVVQQCLREDSEAARFRPDVLVVAVRPEDRAAAGDGDPDEEPDRIADAALAAAGRWGSLLVWVLPPLPLRRPGGVGDPDGVMSRAVAARERVRRRMDADPHACTVDLEDAVRTVGIRRSHDDALYRFARIPFTEDVFLRLGEDLGRVVAARLGQGCHGVLLDLDRLAEAPELDELAALLRAVPVHRPVAALRNGSMSSREPVWSGAGPMHELAGATASSLSGFSEQLGVTVSTVVLVTTPGGVECAAGAGVRIVTWDGDPGPAGVALQASGALDTVVPVTAALHREARADPGHDVLDRPGIEDFLAGLEVTVEISEVCTGAVAETEVGARAHDFTLATDRTADEFVDAAGSSLLSATVRDRYGDYGVSAVIGVRTDHSTWVVELFSVSCVVMGKGVEDVVLDALLDRAVAGGAEEVEFRLRDTGRNRPAIEFLAGAARRAGEETAVPLRTVRLPDREAAS